MTEHGNKLAGLSGQFPNSHLRRSNLYRHYVYFCRPRSV